MSRYIDADELFKRFEKSLWFNNADRDDVAEEILLNMPTADVQEVKHGKWIETDQFIDELTYTCSVCKEDVVLIDVTPKDNLWNYCPNCGAKMDGGKQ